MEKIEQSFFHQFGPTDFWAIEVQNHENKISSVIEKQVEALTEQLPCMSESEVT